MNKPLPEDDILSALETLKNSGTILYPTDTVWGLGCDATDFKAVQKIFSIKRRAESKSLIVLVSSFEMIRDYVENIPDIAFDLIQQISKPTTIIYSGAKNLASNVVATDGSIGIRIVKEPFCEELIRQFGKAIVSTSANISDSATPALFQQIPEEIISETDYVVKYKQDVFERAKPSTIIRLYESGEYKIIRE
jgi:L-threonylcarbamoyladenylate synthase